MPIYEYQCERCGEKFELFVRTGAAAAVPTCPKCGSVEVHKALSLFGVRGGGAASPAGDAGCGSGASL